MRKILPGASSIAALAIAALVVAAGCRMRERAPDAPPPLRASWTPPTSVDVGAGADFPFGLALSPDGRRVVYPATRNGVISLQLDDLTTGRSTPLPATESAASPFWSADGTRIGFFSNGRVRSIDLASGSAADLAEAPNGRGGAWNAAGDLVFAPAANGPLMLRDSAGTTHALTSLDQAGGETSHRWPAFLSDGRHFLYLARGADAARSGIWIASLDQPSDRTRLLSTESQTIVSGNTLLFASSDALMKHAIDPGTWTVTGSAQLAGLPVGRGPLDQLFATSSSDVLIFGAPGTSMRELRWVTRNGSTAGQAGEPAEAWDLRISPDDERIAVTEVDPQTRSLDVWLQDKSRPVSQRLSLSIDADSGGVWSPDGSRVAYISARRRVTIRGSGAVLPEQTLDTFDGPVQMWDWSRDSGWLIVGRTFQDTQDDLWLLPQVEGIPARPYAKMPFNQTRAAVSPDSKWIAYASDESGKPDIYIDSFPTPGRRIRVTTAGGTEPRWRGDGTEIYFRRGTQIHAVTISSTSKAIEATATVRLFDAGADIRAYDVTAKGDRFLLNVPVGSAAPRSATMVINWK